MSQEWMLSEICQILQVQKQSADMPVTGFSIDSRTITPGSVFFAIQGDSLDGHAFIPEAIQKGAIAVVVQQPISEVNVPVLTVSDTTQALGKVAHAIHKRFHPKTAAVTGSCGKSTVKTMLGNILKTLAPTLIPQKNYNNQWGLPLTLFELDAIHQYAVLEFGADHIGEIAALCAIATPDVAILTCAQPVHIEKFGSLANIVKGKGEIFEGLSPNGVAIVNADDPAANTWRQLIQPSQSIISFGLKQPADVTAKAITWDTLSQPAFELCYKEMRIPIRLNLMGEHNIANALAAAAAAFALGIPSQNIQQGLNNTVPVPGRLVRKQGINGALLIDDTYNANPHALRAALVALKDLKEGTISQHKILVLGDMLELGEEKIQLHFEAGKMAKEAGVEKLYAYGPLSAEAVKAFGAGASHYDSHEALTTALKADLNEKTTVLFKASRGMRLEKVVQAIMQQVGE